LPAAIQPSYSWQKLAVDHMSEIHRRKSTEDLNSQREGLDVARKFEWRIRFRARPAAQKKEDGAV